MQQFLEQEQCVSFGNCSCCCQIREKADFLFSYCRSALDVRFDTFGVETRRTKVKDYRTKKSYVEDIFVAQTAFLSSHCL